MIKNIVACMLVLIGASLFLCSTTEKISDEVSIATAKEYVFNVVGDTATFSWKAPKNDSVNFFQLYYRTESDPVWNKIPTKMDIPYSKEPKVKVGRSEIASPDSILYIGLVSVFNNGKKSLLHKSMDSTATPPNWALRWVK